MFNSVAITAGEKVLHINFRDVDAKSMNPPPPHPYPGEAPEGIAIIVCFHSLVMLT